jgi:hypothetical protein
MFSGKDFVQAVSAQTISEHYQAGLFNTVNGILDCLAQVLGDAV